MESISRISSMLETARDLTLEAARDAGPRTKLVRPLPPAQIKKLLDSRHEREVLDGLRRVIAMQYANPPQPTLTFFPAVLKTLSNPYPSTRPLVYNYLLHHAELDPDTALLSVNTIQKSLSDSNPRVRAMALKTMAGIRVPVIAQIVSLAIKKGTSDLSPVVRKVAALACVKCVKLDPNSRPQVEEYIVTLLGDKQYYVAGAALQAFMEICPDRLDMIHPVYRKLCRMAVDMDEWGQLALLKLMTYYARKCFPKRSKRVKRTMTQEQRAKDFYEDLEPKEEDESEFEEIDFIDPDLELFLKSIRSLLQSRNSAVIVAVTRAYLYLSPSTYLPHAIGPLIALLRSPQDVQEVALYNIVQVCLSNPKHFVPYMRHFLIRATEAPQIWILKLEILTLIFSHSPKEIQDLILAELEHFSKSQDEVLVRESVRAIGRCAQSSDATTSRRCLSLLLKQIRSPDQSLVGEAIEVIRHLTQRSPDEHQKTVIRLAKNLDTLTSPTARASIIWLVGEFAGYNPEESIAADVLRILVKNYADETDEVRAQIILLAAKVYLHHLNAQNAKQKALDALKSSDQDADLTPDQDSSLDPSSRADDDPHPIERLFTHTLILARYTPSYDLRDRARLYRALLAVKTSTDLASLLLLAPKPVPQAPSPSEARRNLTLGSATLVVGHEVNGSSSTSGTTPRGANGPLPDWVEDGHEPDPALRDEESGRRSEEPGVAGGIHGSSAVRGSAGAALDRALAADGSYRPGGGLGMGGGKGKGKTLDDWLDEESGEEEESESEEETEEETEGSEEEDETDSEEEEDESEEESEEDDERAGLVSGGK